MPPTSAPTAPRCLFFCVIAGAALCLSACRDSAYAAAAKEDTTEALRRYVAQHPASEHAEVALDRLAELEFEEAKRLHTVVAYKRFLDANPNAPQGRTAQALLETLRYTSAKDAGTALALRGFLKDHPSGAHREDAERALAELELKELTTLDDPAALKQLVGKYPDDPRVAKATEKLDDAAWAEATGAAQLFDYLRSYPAGTHRDDAKVRLLVLEARSLLASGDLDGATALVGRSPLAKKAPELPGLLSQAREEAALARSKDERVTRARIAWSLRSFEDVKKSLTAPDALDRWQAAQELGAFVAPKTIEPLLEVLRAGRGAGVRVRAFESLAQVLSLLPREVADYEVARRLDAARGETADAQVVLPVAVLLDLSGQLGHAAAEYRRAWDAQNPDPVVLKRWTEIRLERRQFFSAAVAARQLSLWSRGALDVLGPLTATTARGHAREGCAALELGRYAAGVIAQVEGEKTEFPEDVVAFGVHARETMKLAAARVRDAELLLLEQDARALRCGDDAVARRLAEAEKVRLAALDALGAKPPKELPALLREVARVDPSPAVRERARALAPR